MVLRREELIARHAELGNVEKVADELGVNWGYVAAFIKHGAIPTNKDIRKKMGLYVPSEGALLYQALNEKARVAGWKNWAEYYRGILAGDYPLMSKPASAYWQDRDRYLLDYSKDEGEE